MKAPAQEQPIYFDIAGEFEIYTPLGAVMADESMVLVTSKQGTKLVRNPFWIPPPPKRSWFDYFLGTQGE